MKECENIEDEVQPTSEGLGKKIGSMAGRARDASKKVGDTASSTVVEGSKAFSTKVSDAGGAAAGQARTQSKKTLDAAGGALASAGSSVQDASKKVSDAGGAAAERVTTHSKQALDATGGALASAGSSIQDASKKVSDAGGAAAERVTTHSKQALDAAGDALASAGSSIQDASKKVSDVGGATAGRVTMHSKQALDAAGGAANVLLSTTSTTWVALAGDLSGTVNDAVQNMVKGAPTIYDKAMDATYLATHKGGSYHRLFDGGHTIWDAVRVGHAASPDDNIIQEAVGILQGLLRDVSTPRGLPIANWDHGTYNRVAETLETNFHIPKGWFYDINTFDAAELLGAAVGVVAIIFSWNRADTETFSKLVAGMGLSTVFTANPLLLILTVVALGRAFQKARQTGEYAEFVDGQFKGAVGAGATLAAVSLVGAASGPAGAALLAGLAAGVLAQYAVRNVKVVEIGKSAAKQVAAAVELTPVTASQIAEFAAVQAVDAANEVKSMIERKQLPSPACGCGCGAVAPDPLP